MPHADYLPRPEAAKPRGGAGSMSELVTSDPHRAPPADRVSRAGVGRVDVSGNATLFAG